MGSSSTNSITDNLDLRGLSNGMIAMHILRLFHGHTGRLSLNCHFDDDPSPALHDLERHSCHWNFQRVDNAHWIIRNFAMTWEESFVQLKSIPVMPDYLGPERRQQER